MSISFSVKEWSTWQANDSEQSPIVKDLPMMLRRRLSRLGKVAMRIAYNAKSEKTVPLVFSSGHGDSEQTVKLLCALANNEPVSPAGFSMSVHNSLAGLLSIATKNTQCHSAISAGRSSFCNGLMEAACLLQEDATDGVLLVHYDEPLTDFYEPYRDVTGKSAGLALLLDRAEGETLELTIGKAEGDMSEEEGAASFADLLQGKKKYWSWSDGRTYWAIKNAM
jgi:hypothetical protein